MYTIKTPVNGYTGYGYGLSFINGMATTDNEKLAKRLETIGYSVSGGADYQQPPAPGQYDYAPDPAPTPYTQEQLEQIAQTENGRKELFAIADSKGIGYPPNVPTARLIDQILASQAG